MTLITFTNVSLDAVVASNFSQYQTCINRILKKKPQFHFPAALIKVICETATLALVSMMISGADSKTEDSPFESRRANWMLRRIAVTFTFSDSRSPKWARSRLTPFENARKRLNALHYVPVHLTRTVSS